MNRNRTNVSGIISYQTRKYEILIENVFNQILKKRLLIIMKEDISSTVRTC